MAITPTQAHSTLLEPGPEEFHDGHDPEVRPSERCTRPAVWPARGYLLVCQEGTPVWPHLKSALQRDGYEPLVLDAREDTDENR
jgi:hypothetical protein